MKFSSEAKLDMSSQRRTPLRAMGRTAPATKRLDCRGCGTRIELVGLGLTKRAMLAASLWALVLPIAALAAGSEVAAARPAPLQVQAWNEHTWASLRAKGPRPAAYMFTASYCSTCLKAYGVVRQAAQGSRHQIEWVAVLTDVIGEQAQSYAAHLPGLTKLYAFDGFEPAIRQSVDPSWANITPYIVLEDRQGQLQRVLGTPDASTLQRWLK